MTNQIILITGSSLAALSTIIIVQIKRPKEKGGQKKVYSYARGKVVELTSLIAAGASIILAIISLLVSK